MPYKSSDEYKAYQKEYHRAYYKDRCDKGECADCRKPARPDILFCAECAEKRRLKAAKLRADRLAVGLCAYCGKFPKHPGKQECEKCLARYGDIGIRFRRGRDSAKRRGLPWTITREEYTAIISQPCDYCGGPLNPTGYGLDQMSPGVGYHRTNVVPCCKRCNAVKMDEFTYDEMQDFIAPGIRASDAARLKSQAFGVPWPTSCG